MTIYYPHIKIVYPGSSAIATTILFVEKPGVEVDISATIEKVEWMHDAGDIPRVILTIPRPVTGKGVYDEPVDRPSRDGAGLEAERL